jgi:hypothetical protein
MKTTHRNRTIAAGALAAVLAAGAGVAAVGTGAIALGGGSAGAAIVTKGSDSGTRIVTLRSDELYGVAHDTDNSKQVCSDPLLANVEGSCNIRLPKCAMQWEKSPGTVVVVFDLNTGLIMSCNRH